MSWGQRAVCVDTAALFGYALWAGMRRQGITTMKRSTVNDIIRDADAFIRSFGYIMPPFAYWSP